MRIHIRVLGKFARLATFACLCAFSAPIWAAGNAYVSVTASAGTVVCDGLDFYVVPSSIGHVESVDIHVSARPGWKLESPGDGVGVASGGGRCDWSVVSEDGVNPEDSASGSIWVGEVVVSGMPDMMLRREERFATLSYSPQQIKRYAGVSVSSDNADVKVSIVEEGRKIKLQRVRAREDVACGSDNARVTVSLGGARSGVSTKSRLTTVSEGTNLNTHDLGASSIYDVACRKDISYLSDAVAAEADDVLTAGVLGMDIACFNWTSDFLTQQGYFNGDFFVKPVTPELSERAATFFADELAIACGDFAGKAVSALVFGDGFSGVVLESWRWNWKFECDLNFVGGDLVLNPPRATMGWLNSFQKS